VKGPAKQKKGRKGGPEKERVVYRGKERRVEIGKKGKKELKGRKCWGQLHLRGV